MTDPTIVCPHCRKEIKLNESLAAPLLESTRREFDKQLAAKDADVAARAAILKSQEDQLAAAKAAVDEDVRIKTAAARAKIAADENKKARLAAAADIEQKNREMAELNEVLKIRNEKLGEMQAAQAELLRARRQLEEQKQAMDLAIETATETARAQAKVQLDKDRAAIAAHEAGRVRTAMEAEMISRDKLLAEVRADCESKDAKLAEAMKSQAESMRKQRELDQARLEMDVTIEKRVGETVAASLNETYGKAKRDVEDAIGLKLAEKDLAIETMKRHIEDLKRTSEQGSQQAQGEVLELLLEHQLGAKFPHDRLEPVAKGEHGGDLLHRVHLPTGSRCGSILWETKRTKHWSDGWLSKLREDQQAAKAEVAVIVSFALPKGVEIFDQLDGIWIIHPRSVIPMATALRDAIVAVHNTRQSGLGQLTKMEQIYTYLTGPRFRLRMEAIIESYEIMRDELNKEKKLILKQWSKRESQIERLMTASLGMYGEMQDIAGASLPELKGTGLIEMSDKDSD